MAVLTLEDFSGRFPVIVFPKTYHLALKDIFEDNVVAIEGRFNTDERESKIIALSVRTLPCKEPVQVWLQIAAYLENDLVQRELLRIFAKYKGDDVVYLRLLGSRKVIKTNPGLWVNSDAPGFAEDITKLLGENCLVKR